MLLRHPDVRQVAVIGVPDERLGEVGMAFVVTDSTDPGVGEAILTWAKEQMANYKVPRAIALLDELPINATGKVVKDELRARAATR
jgi:acyl-CoA synthetase (AMP-forming)/AMP-acid ligase II